MRRLGNLYDVRDDRGGEPDGFPLLSVSQIHGVVPRSELMGDEGRASNITNYKVCLTGDVVINRMSAYNGAIGVTRQNGVVSPDYLVLTPRRYADPRFIAYWLKSHWGQYEIISRLRGIGSPGTAQVRTPRVNEPDLRRIPGPFPNERDQQAIADFLDRETRRIDELIAEQRGLIEILRERRQAAVSSAFNQAGPANSRLKYHSVIQTGVTLNGEGADGLPEYPYLRVANVQVGRVDTKDLKTVRVTSQVAEKSLLRAGDVLMTEGGDIDKLGRGAVWGGQVSPVIHQNHIFAVRPSDSLNSRYLTYWLDCPGARRYFFVTAKKTTNLASTNKWVIGNLPIPWTSIERQQNLVTKLDDQTSRIDALIAESEDLIALSQERRAALITAAVTGEVDVRMAA